MLGKYCTSNISERDTLAFILAFLWHGACTECTLGDYSAVQTPGFSPPAPAPAKKTPAPGKKLRLRQKTCEN